MKGIVINMNVIESIKSRRTIRKFRQMPIMENDIKDIIECARLAPTGANLQSLKYAVVKDETVRKQMFPYIKYAGYLPGWNPTFDECPPVFIVIVNDTDIKPDIRSEVDCGAAIMSMCLAALDKGIGSCWLGAIDRDKIKDILNLKDNHSIAYILGLGYPDQDAKAVPMADSIKYYFDDEGTVCVPKRGMEEILIK